MRKNGLSTLPLHLVIYQKHCLLMQGDPFASDSEDKTYVCPEIDVDSSDSHLTSSDDGDNDDPE